MIPGFPSERIGINTKASPTWKLCLFCLFMRENKKLFWQSWLKHCLLSCTKDSQKSKVCLPTCSVILKSNTKWCPDIQEFFLWKEASHKRLLCYSLQLWQRIFGPAIDGQSSGRMDKRVGGKCELWDSFTHLCLGYPYHKAPPPPTPLRPQQSESYPLSPHPVVNLHKCVFLISEAKVRFKMLQIIILMWLGGFVVRFLAIIYSI